MRASDDGQYYLYGVVVEGVFIRLFVTKTGGLNDDFARAAAQSASSVATPPPPPPVDSPTL